jgi:PAS domain S-box-containing protein
MRHRILIVDANANDARLASTVLEIAGYDVQHAASAQQALALVSDFVPDLILLDISSPDIDPMALTRQVMADARLRQVPVVALSAVGVRGAAERAGAAGYSGHIAKPIDGSNLAAKISVFLTEKAVVKTILIVDDYPAHLELLWLQLQAAGHVVLKASNGIEALEVMKASRGQLDGIVSDVLMPQMDGYGLCLEVRKSESFGALPFVLYSGTHNSAEDRRLARAVGADAFIEKPAPIQAILASLGAAAGKHRPPSARVAMPDLEAPVLKQYSEALVRKLEEKSAELAQTEARLTGMVEAALDGIVTVDANQNIVLFNSAAEEMFGCSRAEALGQPWTRFVPQRFHDAQREQVAALAETGSNAPQDRLRTVWGLRADGTEFPIESSFSRLDTPQGRL